MFPGCTMHSIRGFTLDHKKPCFAAMPTSRSCRVDVENGPSFRERAEGLVLAVLPVRREPTDRLFEPSRLGMFNPSTENATLLHPSILSSDTYFCPWRYHGIDGAYSSLAVGLRLLLPLSSDIFYFCSPIFSGLRSQLD